MTYFGYARFYGSYTLLCVNKLVTVSLFVVVIRNRECVEKLINIGLYLLFVFLVHAALNFFKKLCSYRS